MKTKMREKVRPKMGKIDIDYQKLHDAFFKWQIKPKLTIHGDLYYEVLESHHVKHVFGKNVLQSLWVELVQLYHYCSLVVNAVTCLPSDLLCMWLCLCREKSLKLV